MDAALLLYILNDEFMVRANLKTVQALGNLQQLTEMRNQSVLAHGYKSISQQDSEQLERRARHFLATYWSLAYPDRDLDEQLKQLCFLRELEA